MSEEKVFDRWPEKYDRWFETPIGKLVREYETELVLSLLSPGPGDRILDAGCGTGLFTRDFLERGADLVGLDVSLPMLKRARELCAARKLPLVGGDMLRLPFRDEAFDKVVSVTALEFIHDGKAAVAELFRVTRGGGTIVVATLNRLSPWAERRTAKTRKGERHILEGAVFRSPEELLSCAPAGGEASTAIHFKNDAAPEDAREIERRGNLARLQTGAFVASRFVKPPA
jgi:ubiquinone/menaquinone biosynthesis C-methylase UbiE